MQKPSALLQCPFSLGLWIDLDCEIRGSLDPLFHALTLGGQIALVQEPLFIQEYDRKLGLLLEGEVGYNAGVIAFRKDAKVLSHWVQETLLSSDTHVGDQGALNRAIFLHHVPVIELPIEYNWLRASGPNPEALLYHFTGGKGKIEILQSLQNALSSH